MEKTETDIDIELSTTTIEELLNTKNHKQIIYLI